ncbi:MAG: hypothetical protein HYS09_06405 [Chloroflexi bacterium]|nr:hypothetical protein [Chloroflexota bacterium]
MPLYLVQHTHPADTCPTKNPEMVRQLANHVNQATADKYGVKILADWVNEPEHTVILVLEADTPDKATNFVLPFLNVGSITVRAGQTCEQVARDCLGG